MEETAGFVYILEVSDIILPVCKIGMTTRSPQERCNEINNSSTGDFIWSVSSFIYVSDCKKLESLIHLKLKPLRQKGREFFNLNAEDASKALSSIFESQSEIKKIENNNKYNPQEKQQKRKKSLVHIKPEQVEILQSFASLLKVKGRPFGQKGKPEFGISDGKTGVQYNLAIHSDTGNIRLGVNLEGSQKTGLWLIAPFILSELENPTIEKLKTKLDINPSDVIVIFTRDAWQGAARLNIVEKYLGGKEFSLSEINSELWKSILKEALTCLDKDKGYKGRKNKQLVTLKNGNKEVEKNISPHLSIKIKIENKGDVTNNLQIGIEKLKPIYDWVNEISSKFFSARQ